MRFVCGDVRDLIVSHKNDHGPSHRRYRALQRERRLKIRFREIFGVVRFSTFATISAMNRHGHYSVISLARARNVDDTVGPIALRSGWERADRRLSPSSFLVK
jgi:ADP-ribose pyrophosphatase YjhB (NUDIX family)